MQPTDLGEALLSRIFFLGSIIFENWNQHQSPKYFGKKDKEKHIRQQSGSLSVSIENKILMCDSTIIPSHTFAGSTNTNPKRVTSTDSNKEPENNIGIQHWNTMLAYNIGIQYKQELY